MDKTTQFFTDSDWEGILLLVFFCKQYCSRCQSLDIWKAPQLYHVSSLFVTWRPPRLHGIWKDEGKIPICRFAWTFFPRLGLPWQFIQERFISCHYCCHYSNKTNCTVDDWMLHIQLALSFASFSSLLSTALSLFKDSEKIFPLLGNIN